MSMITSVIGGIGDAVQRNYMLTRQKDIYRQMAGQARTQSAADAALIAFATRIAACSISISASRRADAASLLLSARVLR